MKALGSMFPRNGSNAPNVLTSAHGVLFACALETKDYASVEPFIDLHVDEIANENCIQDQEKSDNRERDFGDVFLGRMKVHYGRKKKYLEIWIFSNFRVKKPLKMGIFCRKKS